MPSKFAKLYIAPTALIVLLGGASAFAQDQSSTVGDPFAGVSAVDSDQMSAVSGELAGGIGAGTSAPAGAGNCDAGAQCAGGVPSNAIGSPTREVSAIGNTTRVSVTAVNIQNSVVGPGVVNTGGGLNSAGSGN